MLLLIIEIYLTIKAYKNGWGIKALMPLGLIVGFGVVLGVLGYCQSWGLQQLYSLRYIVISVELLMVAVTGSMARQPHKNLVHQDRKKEQIDKLEDQPAL